MARSRSRERRHSVSSSKHSDRPSREGENDHHRHSSRHRERDSRDKHSHGHRDTDKGRNRERSTRRSETDRSPDRRRSHTSDRDSDRDRHERDRDSDKGRHRDRGSRERSRHEDRHTTPSATPLSADGKWLRGQSVEDREDASRNRDKPRDRDRERDRGRTPRERGRSRSRSRTRDRGHDRDRDRQRERSEDGGGGRDGGERGIVLPPAPRGRWFAKEYDPLAAGSIDGTDKIPHDRAVVRAMQSNYNAYKDPHIRGDPSHTLYVGRLDTSTSEDRLREIFGEYGRISNIRLVRDAVTGHSRGYAFIEYQHERDFLHAYRAANKQVIDGREILVDCERERLMPGWVPRRFGGGLTGKKESGQLRFGGRDKPFRDPIVVDNNRRPDAPPFRRS